MNSSCTRARGFTLLGIITALSIAIVFTASAIPSLTALISNQRLTASSNDLFHGIIFARSEAIKSNGRITIASNEDDWNKGWVIYADDNDNGFRETQESILRETGRLQSGLRLRGNQPVKKYISYVGTGQAERISGSIQMGTLMLCDDTTNLARAIIISSSGRPRISSDAKDFKPCLT